MLQSVPFHGPIPEGQYEIQHHYHRRWWRLERQPKYPFRGGFVLHDGSRSEGCITLNKGNPDLQRTFSVLDVWLSEEAPFNNLEVTR